MKQGIGADPKLAATAPVLSFFRGFRLQLLPVELRGYKDGCFVQKKSGLDASKTGMADPRQNRV